MISEIWSRQKTHGFVARFSHTTLTMQKLDNGYECRRGEELIFKAIKDKHGYLVIYDNKLLAVTPKS